LCTGPDRGTSWRIWTSADVPLLILFTAGNLLPHQVIITPLYQMFLEIPLPEFMSESEQLYDSYCGLITIHVAAADGWTASPRRGKWGSVGNELQVLLRGSADESDVARGVGVGTAAPARSSPVIRPGSGWR
jgi:hypothetical protein